MYKIIPFILLIYWSFFSYSQTTFNKIYSPCGNNPTTGFAATSILSKGSGYIISGTGYDTINNNYTSLFFYKVDSVGNITKIKSFTQIGWYHYYNSASLIELKNGGYLYLGEKDSSNTNPIHYII